MLQEALAKDGVISLVIYTICNCLKYVKAKVKSVIVMSPPEDNILYHC